MSLPDPHRRLLRQLRDARLARGMTQLELAHTLRLSRAQYSALETGRSMVNLVQLHKLSEGFINELALVAPDLALWVSSRRFELASALAVRANLHTMLSLDASTPRGHVAQARRLVDERHTVYLAWVQQDPDEPIPEGVKVVFAEHHRARRAPWTAARADPRTCPATVAAGPAHEGACARCRYCFDNSVRSTPKGTRDPTVKNPR